MSYCVNPELTSTCKEVRAELLVFIDISDKGNLPSNILLFFFVIPSIAIITYRFIFVLPSCGVHVVVVAAAAAVLGVVVEVLVLGDEGNDVVLSVT